MNLHGLARLLAAAESYGGSRFVSLSERFRVSREAMAIRLKDLNWLKF